MQKPIYELLSPLGSRVRQEVKTLIISLVNNGYDVGKAMLDVVTCVDNFNEYLMKEVEEHNSKVIEYAGKGKKCPNCKLIMRCYPVNTNAGNQVGGNWKSQWRCWKCDYEEFSNNDYKVELKNYGIG